MKRAYWSTATLPTSSAEADAALQDLGADIAGYAYVTTTITVLG